MRRLQVKAEKGSKSTVLVLLAASLKIFLEEAAQVA
jgi:hypothetical protein